MTTAAHPAAWSIGEIADALGITKRPAEKRSTREAWPYTETPTRGGMRRLYPLEGLPDDVQRAIVGQHARASLAQSEADAAACPDRAKRAADAWSRYQWARGWRKDIALHRQAALFEVARLQGDGMSLREARAVVAARLKTEGVTGGSDGALKRWGRLVKGASRTDWLALLLPEEKSGRPETPIHPGAWQEFKGDWLRAEQPTSESSYRRVQRLAAIHPEWHPLPHLNTFKNRVLREVPRGVRVLAREGREALARMGPKIERNRSELVAMQEVNSDGHTFDVAVRYPDGTIGRPVIVGWQDIASGKLLSYRIGRSETAELVRLSFCDMVAEFGIPARATLDNGRAYASKKNTGGVPTRYRYKVRAEDPEGVIVKLGTEVRWVTPYNGKAKPIERTWRDFAQDISKRQEFAGAYLGNSPTTKPENYGSHAVPWETFLAVIADGIAEHNARVGRRSKACEGNSFDATFAASYATATIKKASAAQLSMLLLASDVVLVRGDTGEVTIGGNRYWSEQLCEAMGSKVELRFDPAALHNGVHAFRLDGHYIGAVPCVAATGYETTDQMQAALKAQRNWLKAHKQLLRAEKARDAANDPRPLPPVAEPAPVFAGVTALHFPKRKPTPIDAEPELQLPSVAEQWAVALMKERKKNAL